MCRIPTIIFFLTLTFATVYAEDSISDNSGQKTGLFKRIIKGKKNNKTEISSKQSVPRTAEVIWYNEEMIPADSFINKFHTTVPDSVRTLELLLTNSVNGWYTEGKVIHILNGGTSLHKGMFYTYDDFGKINLVFQSNGAELIPVFDLSVRNEVFEEITGHNMLSVEGYRFVRAILIEFIQTVAPSKIAFIIPEGKYRVYTEQIMDKYPDTTYYFIN